MLLKRSFQEVFVHFQNLVVLLFVPLFGSCVEKKCLGATSAEKFSDEVGGMGC